MACNHPKIAYKTWSEELRKFHVSFGKPLSDQSQEILVPCGKCIGCKADRAQQWAVRCQLEAIDYPGKCWFITLTYDDAFLPLCECCSFDPETAEYNGSAYVPTLCKDHFRKFVKDVRNRYGAGIRFFACGEYGEKTGRSHYHAVFFNLDLTDTVPFKAINGNLYFTSDTLSGIWNKGHVLLAPYEFATGAYVAKYLCKSEMVLDPGFIDDRERPFLLMSRRPGIGRRYFDDNKERIYHFDKVTLPGQDGAGARTVLPPHFFDRIMRASKDPADVDRLLECKDKRFRVSKLAQTAVETQTDVALFDRLKNEEVSKIKAKRLRN